MLESGLILEMEMENEKIDVTGAYIDYSRIHDCFFVVRNKNSVEVEKIVETHFQRKIEAEAFIKRNSV